MVTNNNNALFSAQPAVSPAGTLTFTPAPNASGAATVTVKLKDGSGTANGGQDTSGTQTFQITVAAANDAPVNNVPGAQDGRQKRDARLQRGALQPRLRDGRGRGRGGRQGRA